MATVFVPPTFQRDFRQRVPYAAAVKSACLLLCAFCALLRPTISQAAPAPPTTPQPPPDDPLKRISIPLPRPPQKPFKDGKFAIRPGEVIVFTGPTHMVFEQQQGWLETLLATAAREQRPIFRHMSWEGDTVYEQPRELNFGSWKSQFEAVGATTVFTWFGQMEALDDTRTEADFEKAYAALLDDFKTTVPRIVVIGPLPFFRPANPHVPDNTARNERVKAHSEIAAKLAKERGLIYVDMHKQSALALRRFFAPGQPISENGIHLLPEAQHVISGLTSLDLKLSQDHLDFPEDIRREIIAKNRLWFDAWRTMNWAFAYGDRTSQLFGQGIDGRPKMAIELEQFKPLIATADARVHALALGQPPPPMPKPLPEVLPAPEPPEIEQRTLKLRDGFQVNLFASEANGLIKPLQIRWDAQGRLWAACTPSYPQIMPGVIPDDYLLVCEDTDGDGRADKFTRFAEGLTMPMGMEFGDGGVYVCESTQLVHLRDTDGDGRADQRRVILSGFGTGDSHQLINSLRWGPDGCLWFSQGLHINARVETPWGLARMEKAGIWRFNPRTLRLDDFFGGAQAGANCWGVVFDDWGQPFHVAADNRMAFYSTPGLVPVETPERYYEIGPLAVSRVKGMELEILGSRHLPDDLQGALVKSTYFMNNVLLFKLVDDGSGFKTEDLGELISSSETAFRPVETKQGPDGAIYVCDWFNPVIGHYQASYRDPKRDRVHGRIWRITAKERPLAKTPKIAALKTAELLDQLVSPERWARERARQELFSRPKPEVIPATDAWLKKLSRNNAPPESLREIISIYAAHEEHRTDVLQRLLDSPEPRLRAWGTRFIGLWAANNPSPALRAPSPPAARRERDDVKSGASISSPSPHAERGERAGVRGAFDPLALAAKMVADPSARVRLEAVVAASYIPRAEAIEVAARALDQPHDRFIDYALRAAARALKPHWQPALASGKLTFGGKAEHLAFVVQADASPESIAQLRQIAGDNKLNAQTREGLLIALANVGEAGDLDYVLQQARTSPRVLHELATVASLRNKRPAGDLSSAVKSLLDANQAPLKVAGLKLAAAWKTKPLQPAVQSLTKSDSEEKTVRVAAIETFAALAGKEAAADLSTLAASPVADVAQAAVAALAPLDLASAASHATRALAATRSDKDAAALLQPFLSRQKGAETLATALTAKPPSADGAKLALQALGALGRDEPKLRDVLYKAAGLLVTEPPAYSAELVAKLIAEAKSKGNARNGKALFSAQVTACNACHKIGNEGGTLGPDLSAIGRGMTPELIVESVLWPRRQIKEGFLLTSVTLADGSQQQGYIHSESAAELVLRDPASGVETRLRKPTIKERADSGTLMPEGLTAALSSEQVRDLLRYLMELGR